jgi:hypothetical protein
MAKFHGAISTTRSLQRGSSNEWPAALGKMDHSGVTGTANVDKDKSRKSVACVVQEPGGKALFQMMGVFAELSAR